MKHVRPYILSLLPILFPLLLTAQEMEHNGVLNRPRFNGSMQYRTIGASGEQAFIAGLFLSSPRWGQTFEEWGIEILPEHVFRGFALGLRAGLRYASTGNHNVLWRATLADFDLASTDFPIQWATVCDHRPLWIIYRNSGLGYLVGATLLDYDKSGQAALDARWLQTRIGLIYSGEEQLSPFFRIALAAGATTFTPGTANYEVFDNADESLFGLEAGGSISAGMEFSWGDRNYYVAGQRSLLSLTADAKLRTITVDREFRIVSLGGTLRGFFVLPWTCTDDREWAVSRGIEMAIRVRREFLQAGNREHRTDLLETGIQYTFDMLE